MAFVLANRVKETSTSTGTGDMLLAGASTGYQSFAVIGNNNQTYYTIAGGSQWEVGIGTYETTGPNLQRDTVLSNSLGTTAFINFSAGTKDVFVTYPEERSVYAVDQVVISDTGAIYANKTAITINTTVTSGYNAMSVGPVTFNNAISVTVTSGQKWIVL